MNIFGQRDLLIFITQLFSNYQIEYMLTGSFAVSYYGLPRATHDIDFIIEVTEDAAQKLERAMTTLGNEFIADIPNIQEAMRARSLFTIFHLETGIKVDFWMVRTDDFQLKMKRGQNVPFETSVIHVISAEDLILNKLVWCKEVMSERHMRDCVGIWNVQGEKLDFDYLQQRAKSLGVTELLQEVIQLPL